MTDRYDRKHSFSEKSDDDPPNSRLFIICSKQVTEEDLQNEFAKFGKIDEIWIVRDRQTGESKGVAYIKYTKTSEAAFALENMNGKMIANCSRRLKVMIAASRDQGSRRDENEEEKLQRLFVLVPKNMTDDELYQTFKDYGEIEYANIIRDRETKESKGFAYVKFFKFTSAAKAFEECDRKFKPVFAEPRKPKQEMPDKCYSSKLDSYSSNTPSIYSKTSITLPEVNTNEYFTKLQVVTDPYVNQDQLWRLFDIVPGMEFCELRQDNRSRPSRCFATVVYNSHQSAAYAKEKLHGFEYPPGSRLIVKPEIEQRSFFDQPKEIPNPLANKGILELAETIAKATTLLQAAKGIPGISDLLPESSKLSNTVCNVSLPDPQPLADIDAECITRCFIVCSPNPPPMSIMKDIFSRFGNLIDVYMLNNRNCGYAKYATKESAESAIKTLHGAEVCGIRLKVMQAEEPKNERKRMKLEINPY
ncbi:RNA-binding protein 45 [Agrilus planipennis]|uniref:RNA-binding protein 45 n=1 Tax=Agrilus planipennis TaxID=224129 RepID=A0A1W4W9L0_AGRPL|nr:RNA-binding protein 45 [Agrilus planipennis]XP_018320724.1 RNA-binding protein 45 [Agrilus planipennis]XP_018320725.1 RNA-binding protein 45 [Agrilus planipennis]XP_018320726.1 RNA-binding protein 45 [Agrilus planipennis]XP_025829274.1 RNA-binding protein 45 [Agrilus planipennis]